MARMLGRFTSRGCWSGPRHDGKPCVVPGPDCAGWERDTRAAKRREARNAARDLAGCCWNCGNPYDSTEDGCDACDA